MPAAKVQLIMRSMSLKVILTFLAVTVVTFTSLIHLCKFIPTSVLLIFNCINSRLSFQCLTSALLSLEQKVIWNAWKRDRTTEYTYKSIETLKTFNFTSETRHSGFIKKLPRKPWYREQFFLVIRTDSATPKYFAFSDLYHLDFSCQMLDVLWWRVRDICRWYS